jgi:hypothetical protein
MSKWNEQRTLLFVTTKYIEVVFLYNMKFSLYKKKKCVGSEKEYRTLLEAMDDPERCQSEDKVSSQHTLLRKRDE